MNPSRKCYGKVASLDLTLLEKYKRYSGIAVEWYSGISSYLTFLERYQRYLFISRGTIPSQSYCQWGWFVAFLKLTNIHIKKDNFIKIHLPDFYDACCLFLLVFHFAVWGRVDFIGLIVAFCLNKQINVCFCWSCCLLVYPLPSWFNQHCVPLLASWHAFCYLELAVSCSVFLFLLALLSSCISLEKNIKHFTHMTKRRKLFLLVLKLICMLSF